MKGLERSSTNSPLKRLFYIVDYREAFIRRALRILEMFHRGLLISQIAMAHFLRNIVVCIHTRQIFRISESLHLTLRMEIKDFDDY